MTRLRWTSLLTFIMVKNHGWGQSKISQATLCSCKVTAHFGIVLLTDCLRQWDNFTCSKHAFAFFFMVVSKSGRRRCTPEQGRDDKAVLFLFFLFGAAFYPLELYECLENNLLALLLAGRHQVQVGRLQCGNTFSQAQVKMPGIIWKIPSINWNRNQTRSGLPVCGCPFEPTPLPNPHTRPPHPPPHCFCTVSDNGAHLLKLAFCLIFCFLLVFFYFSFLKSKWWFISNSSHKACLFWSQQAWLV